jgi:protein-S-isoprenylcysteine O-methyltransferase Ste14
MSNLLAIRSLMILVPLLAVGALIAKLKPGRLLSGGASLTVVWNVPTVLFMNVLAVHFGLWTFSASADSSFLGVPVDFWMAEVVLWGPLCLFASSRLPLPVLLIPALIDAVLSGCAPSLIQLQPNWWLGKVIAFFLCIVPAQLLGRWTERRVFVNGRAVLQVLAVSQIVVVMVTLVLEKSGGSWGQVFQNPWWFNALMLPFLGASVVFGYASVHEFVMRGRGGTPVPWDPPCRFVMTGPYSYTANPMHVSFVLLFTSLAVWLQQPAVAVLSVWSVFHGQIFLVWDRAAELSVRHGQDAVSEYKQKVKCWKLSWTPKMPNEATVFIGPGSAPLARVARWFLAKRPAGLEMQRQGMVSGGDASILVAFRLKDGSLDVSGVRALCRLMEAVSLPWAWLSWFVRLPGVIAFLEAGIRILGPTPRESRKLQSEVDAVNDG